LTGAFSRSEACPTSGTSSPSRRSEADRRTPPREALAADSCRLAVTHDQLRDGANEQGYGGWPMVLSGMKTWLETGELLTTPGSLKYG
jgi:hypothetical protein